MHRIALSLLAVSQLSAQELTIYRFNAQMQGVPYCGVVETRGESLMNRGTAMLGSVIQDVQVGVNIDTGVVPREKRSTPGALILEGADKQSFTLDTLAGKVVVLAYFSIECQASCLQMAELGDLQPKEEAFKMRMLPVSFQGWATLQPFLRRNRTNLPKDLKIYLPGTGKNGVVSLQGELHALPLVTLLDRDGKIASSWVGYYPGRLVERLKAIIPEKPLAPVAGATVTKPQ